jgi:uncharacterized protein (DUF885 family)
MLSSMRILPGWADFYSAKLDDASPAHEQKALELVKNSLATLKQYDREKLDREGQLSYDTLAYYLQIQADGEPFSITTSRSTRCRACKARCRTSWCRCTR